MPLLAALPEDSPVIDAGDFLRDPERAPALAVRLARHRRSPTGCCTGRRVTRDSDGVWAPHWYDAVVRSTGFEPWRPRAIDLDEHDAAVAEACRPAYDELHARRLVL